MSPLADRLADVFRRLSSIRGAIRRRFALDGLSRLILVAAAFVVFTFAIDWLLRLPSGVRLVFLFAGISLLVWIIVRRIFRPLSVRISDDDLALMVERQHPELNDRLISAIQLVRNPGSVPTGEAALNSASYNSPELVEELVKDAENATSGVDFNRVLVWRHVGKVLGWAVLTAGILLATGSYFRAYSLTYLNRIVGGAGKYPQLTHLKILDFENYKRIVARGDDLGIAVSFSGKRPSKVCV